MIGDKKKGVGVFRGKSTVIKSIGNTGISLMRRKRGRIDKKGVFVRACERHGGMGYLYLVRLDIDGDIVYKVGVTSRDIKERMSEFPYPCVLLSLYCGIGSKVYSVEQKIHKVNKEHRYHIARNKRFSGYSELYDTCIDISGYGLDVCSLNVLDT